MKTAAGFILALGLAACAAPAAFAAPPAGAQKEQKLSAPSQLAFVLLEFDVKDPSAFKEFASKVRSTLEKYKGDFVMRDKVDSLFGGKPSNLSVISFPNVEDAKSWLNSSDVAKLNEQREKIATVRTYLVEKVN